MDGSFSKFQAAIAFESLSILFCFFKEVYQRILEEISKKINVIKKNVW